MLTEEEKIEAVALKAARKEGWSMPDGLTLAEGSLARACTKAGYAAALIDCRAGAATTGETGAPAGGVGEARQQWLIMKKSRVCTPPRPYVGGTCHDVGIERGRIYDSLTEAEADAEKLTKCNPVGFVVCPVAPAPAAGAPIGAGEASVLESDAPTTELLGQLMRSAWSKRGFVFKGDDYELVDSENPRAVSARYEALDMYGDIVRYLRKAAALTPAASAPAATTAGAAGQGWVSVKERLPEYKGYVIAFLVDGRVIGCYCDPGFNYDEDGETGTVPPSWDAGFYNDKVTHWKPMPAAPQASEGGPGHE